MLTPSKERPSNEVVLEGRYIRLQPLDPIADSQELYHAASGDPQKDAIWDYMLVGPFTSREGFDEYLNAMKSNPTFVTFVVVDKQSNRKIGMTTYLNIVPAHRCVEIGWIWYTPEFHRTYANTESSYLLIKYAFEELKYRRVEWKCNNLNEKSKNAALGLGFKFEGLFRQHYIVKGKNRDTAYFSIIDGEWPEVKTILEAKLHKKS